MSPLRFIIEILKLLLLLIMNNRLTRRLETKSLNDLNSVHCDIKEMLKKSTILRGEPASEALKNVTFLFHNRFYFRNCLLIAIHINSI